MINCLQFEQVHSAHKTIVDRTQITLRELLSTSMAESVIDYIVRCHWQIVGNNPKLYSRKCAELAIEAVAAIETSHADDDK